MVGMFGKKVALGQANGPDVDLLVYGTELYANYETPDGYSAVYDEVLGLFCYARVVNGQFESTGIPVTAPPPADVNRHAREADAVRQKKIQIRMSQMELHSRAQPKKGP